MLLFKLIFYSVTATEYMLQSKDWMSLSFVKVILIFKEYEKESKFKY